MILSLICKMLIVKKLVKNIVQSINRSDEPNTPFHNHNQNKNKNEKLNDNNKNNLLNKPYSQNENCIIEIDENPSVNEGRKLLTFNNQNQNQHQNQHQYQHQYQYQHPYPYSNQKSFFNNQNQNQTQNQTQYQHQYLYPTHNLTQINNETFQSPIHNNQRINHYQYNNKLILDQKEIRNVKIMVNEKIYSSIYDNQRINQYQNNNNTILGQKNTSTEKEKTNKNISLEESLEKKDNTNDDDIQKITDNLKNLSLEDKPIENENPKHFKEENSPNCQKQLFTIDKKEKQIANSHSKIENINQNSMQKFKVFPKKPKRKSSKNKKSNENISLKTIRDDETQRENFKDEKMDNQHSSGKNTEETISIYPQDDKTSIPTKKKKMSRKEISRFLREQPLDFIEKSRKEIDEEIVPLINIYEEKVNNYSCDLPLPNDLIITYRKITVFLMNKIKLIDKIESDNDEILCKRKAIVKYIQKLESETDVIKNKLTEKINYKEI